MATRESISNAGTSKKRADRNVFYSKTFLPETPTNVENNLPREEPHELTPPPREEPVDQLFTLLQQLVNQGKQPANHGQDHEEIAEDKLLSRFLRFNPPRFKGEPDDRKAESWLSEVEKIFRVLNYTEEQRVRYATFLLDEAAHNWWRGVEQRWWRNEIE